MGENRNRFLAALKHFTLARGTPDTNEKETYALAACLRLLSASTGTTPCAIRVACFHHKIASAETH